MCLHLFAPPLGTQNLVTEKTQPPTVLRTEHPVRVEKIGGPLGDSSSPLNDFVLSPMLRGVLVPLNRDLGLKGLDYRSRDFAPNHSHSPSFQSPPTILTLIPCNYFQPFGRVGRFKGDRIVYRGFCVVTFYEIFLGYTGQISVTSSSTTSGTPSSSGPLCSSR